MHAKPDLRVEFNPDDHFFRLGDLCRYVATPTMYSKTNSNSNLRKLVLLASFLLCTSTVIWGVAKFIIPRTQAVNSGARSNTGTPTNDGSSNETIVKFESLNTEQEFETYYRNLFEGGSESNLNDLTSNENDSIAIQAAWELVAATVPRAPSESIYRPDANALKQFLSMFTERFRVTPPDWWQTIVIGARAHHRDNIFPGKLSPWPSPMGVLSEDENGHVTYREGEKTISIPKNIISRGAGGRIARKFVCIFTAEMCFIASYSDHGSQQLVTCLDAQTAQPLWTSRVCGCNPSGSSGTGINFSHVALVEGNNRIFVFGRESTGFYAHGFDSLNGETVGKFSTKY